MISEKTLSRILGYLDEEDSTPDETGCYTVSNTIFGCSSLSRGGSFCDKANNLILSDEIECGNLGGVEERASWPGVYSIVFHPEKMTEESAEKLLEYLVLMDENRRWSEMPCIDENRVYEMEDKEIRETLAEAVQGIIDEYVLLPCNLELDERFINIIRNTKQATSGELYVIEPGPDVFIRDEALKKAIIEAFPQCRPIDVGDLVWWSDPEYGECSKLATVSEVRAGDIPQTTDEITLRNDHGCEGGAFRSECERVKTGKAVYIPYIPSDENKAHQYKTVTILALRNPYENDADGFGLSYFIAFPDGTEGIAYGDELY